MDSNAANQRDSLISFENLSIIILLIIIVLMVVVVIVVVVFLILMLIRRNSEVVKWKEDISETDGESETSDQNSKKGRESAATPDDVQDEFRVIHVETAVDIDLHIDMNKTEGEEEGKTERLEMDKQNGDDQNNTTTTAETSFGLDEFKKAVLLSSKDNAETPSTKDETEPLNKETAVSENPPSITATDTVIEIEPVLTTEKVKSSSSQAVTTPAEASVTVITSGETKPEDQKEKTEVKISSSQAVTTSADVSTTSRETKPENQAKKTEEMSAPSDDKDSKPGTTLADASVMATTSKEAKAENQDKSTPLPSEEKLSSSQAATTSADVSITVTASEQTKLENQDKNTKEKQPSEEKTPKEDTKEEVKA